jgi:flagellar hook assembly protein FlgD
VAALHLAAPSPNPLRSATALSFTTGRTGPVTLDVFDVSGRRVARLLSGERVGAGTHRVEWEGRDDQGRRVVPGVYLVRLETGDGEASRKVTVVR